MAFTRSQSSDSSISIDEVNAALATVNDPEINRPITEIGMVKGVDIRKGGVVEVGVFLTVSGCPMKSTIIDRVTDAVMKVAGVTKVSVELDVMNDEQRANMKKILRGGRTDKENPFTKAGSLTKI